MKPTLTTPDTLLLGMWVEGQRAAIVGTLVREDEEIITEVTHWAGLYKEWATLVDVLKDAAIVGSKHLLIVSNDAALVRALTPPLRAPAADQVDRKWLLGWGKEGQRGGYVDMPFGGDAAHWAAIWLLAAGPWAGRWRVVWSDKLEKARELWRQSTSRQ